MKGLFSRALARARRREGFTLVEVLVSSAMTVILVLATLAALEQNSRAQNGNEKFALAIQDAQTGLGRMMHEVRQAYSVLATQPNAITFLVRLNGTEFQVLYECDVPQPGTSFRECTRTQAAVGGTLGSASSGVPVIQRLTNGTLADPVFNFESAGSSDPIGPTYVEATVKVPAAGALPLKYNEAQLTHSVVLDDAAYLRNANLGAGPG